MIPVREKVKCVLKKCAVQIRKLGDNMKLQSQKKGGKVYYEKNLNQNLAKCRLNFQ